MWLVPRSLSKFKDIVSLPGYYRRGYESGISGYSTIPGVETMFPILVVYQNKKNWDDVLVEVQFCNNETDEQTLLTKEFYEKFIGRSNFKDNHLVEREGRIFFCGNRYDNGGRWKHPCLDSAYATYACHFLHHHGIDSAIALKHEKVVTLENAIRVHSLFDVVNEFKSKFPDDSWENRIIKRYEDEIKSYQEEVAKLDNEMNVTCEQLEIDKATLAKYDINWKDIVLSKDGE